MTRIAKTKRKKNKNSKKKDKRDPTIIYVMSKLCQRTQLCAYPLDVLAVTEIPETSRVHSYYKLNVFAARQKEIVVYEIYRLLRPSFIHFCLGQ